METQDATKREHEHHLSRPNFQRKRSNSFPIGEALGCSAAEASLILAEGRAAVSRRQRHSDQASRPVRRYHSVNETQTSRKTEELVSQQPKEHVETPSRDAAAVSFKHSRSPSELSILSDTTVTGLEEPNSSTPENPLDNYSANLAKFIRSQLNSISSYHRSTVPLSFPRSCPDLSQASRNSASSNARTVQRPVDTPHLISIPPPRPPLRSQFSGWSSTDDSDQTDDELPPLPTVDRAQKESRASTYTNFLQYYDRSNPGSFLFPSTPDEGDHSITSGGQLTNPSRPAIQPSESDSQSPAQSQLTSSSAPSLDQHPTSSSFTSTSSYFDRRPMFIDPALKERVIAAVSPYENRNSKVLTAISPFEGAALTRVHSIFVKNPNQVVVEGMAFDLSHEFKMPNEGTRQVRTPC